MPPLAKATKREILKARHLAEAEWTPGLRYSLNWNLVLVFDCKQISNSLKYPKNNDLKKLLPYSHRHFTIDLHRRINSQQNILFNFEI